MSLPSSLHQSSGSGFRKMNHVFTPTSRSPCDPIPGVSSRGEKKIKKLNVIKQDSKSSGASVG